MRPPGKARRGSKPGVCDRPAQRRPNAEVFRDHCTSLGRRCIPAGASFRRQVAGLRKCDTVDGHRRRRQLEPGRLPC